MPRDLDKREKIKEMMEQGKTWTEIKDKLSCWSNLLSSVSNELKNTLWSKVNHKKPNNSKELAQELKQDNYLETIDKNNAKKEVDRLRIQNKDLIEEVEKSIIADKIYKEVLKDSSKIKIEVANDKESESTAVMAASDRHIEETIDLETMNGLNEYNLKIAEERAKKFFANGMYLVNTLKESQNIKHIVLALLWDFITGYIHPELVENNQISPTEAIIYVKRLLTSGIDFMLETTDIPITIVTAFWNHWRIWEKKRISTGWKNNYEWMMYVMMADEYKNNPRVQFKVEKGYHNYINVYDKVLRTHHWDNMKYQGWVGGITIPVNKAISQWNKAKHADLDLFWHRHTKLDWGIFMSNGSLIWYGMYSESIKASYEEPQQIFFLIDSKYGKTLSAPILLR